MAKISSKVIAVLKNILIFAPANKKGVIAQLVEQRTENPCVPGSIPGGTTFQKQSECSAVGSALRSGRRGRAFESPHSDKQGLTFNKLSLFCSVFVPLNQQQNKNKEHSLLDLPLSNYLCTKCFRKCPIQLLNPIRDIFFRMSFFTNSHY